MQAESGEGIVEREAGRLGAVPLAAMAGVADRDAVVRRPVAIVDIAEPERADRLAGGALIDEEVRAVAIGDLLLIHADGALNRGGSRGHFPPRAKCREVIERAVFERYA